MKRKLLTVAQLAATTPFTEYQLRNWIFNASSTGISSALVRVGRRIYVDADGFDCWIDKHAQEKPTEAAA